MVRELFGRSTLTSMLRGGLEETSATHRVIADRVANAIDSSSTTSFSEELKAKQGKVALTEADLQRDMASLADTQLRYEADARLLKEAYTRLREAIRGRSG